jgi:hypothetical protein
VSERLIRYWGILRGEERRLRKLRQLLALLRWYRRTWRDARSTTASGPAT